MDLAGFALSLLERNPKFANNPMAKEFFDILRSGDTARGQQMAENICDSYGITKEQALQQARQHFGV